MQAKQKISPKELSSIGRHKLCVLEKNLRVGDADEQAKKPVVSGLFNL